MPKHALPTWSKFGAPVWSAPDLSLCTQCGARKGLALLQRVPLAQAQVLQERLQSVELILKRTSAERDDLLLQMAERHALREQLLQVCLHSAFAAVGVPYSIFLCGPMPSFCHLPLPAPLS